MPMTKFMDRAKEWLGLAPSVEAARETRARFLLTYNDLLIGTLTVEGGL